MKKIISLAVAFIAFSTFLQAQFVRIVQAGDTTLLNNDTLVVYGNTTAEMTVNLYIINPSPIVDINVYARRDSVKLPLSLISGNQFCWGGGCWDTNTSVSAGYETIPHGAHDTSNTLNAPDFNGHYYPWGHAVKAYIRYSFYNASNTSDSSWVIVEYNTTSLGVANISDKDISFSAPYPNPANTTVGFNYSLNSNIQAATMKIFNMIGECIQTLPLNTSKNKAVINVQSMPSGIYICEIEASGCQPAYQKLVVSH